MVDYDPAWKRAWKDSVAAQRSARFMWGGEVVVAASFGAGAVALGGIHATVFEQMVRVALGGVTGLLTAFILTFVFQLLVRAPYKQRDEARAEALRRQDWAVSLKEAIVNDIETHPDTSLVEISRRLHVIDTGDDRASPIVGDLVRTLVNEGKVVHVTGGGINVSTHATPWSRTRGA